MVECSNCGLMINKNDKKCPRCGHVFDVKKKEKKILTGVGVAAVGAGVIGAGIASHEKENKSAIENLKNNTISKKTEKIEKVETAKKVDAKDIVESSSKKQTETQKTAYESKKYNDSLEIDKTKESTTKENAPAEKGQKTTEEDNAQKETDNHEEIAKTDNTDDIEIDENESASEEIKTLLEKISEEQDNNEEIEALISMLTENQDSDEELEDLLRKLSEGRTDDETLAALIKKLADGQKNIDDQVDNDLEEDMLMSESTSSGGIGGGDSVNISFYQLENALSILGCATSTSLPNSANGENFDITSCKTKGPAGGLANVFTKIDSEEYNKLNNKEGHNQYKKTLSNFDGSETSFLPKMESKLLKLRQNLIDMMGEDYYKLSLGNEILGSCYDENGEIDMDQAKKLENLWNRLHDDDKKDISSMNGTSLKEFVDSFYANDSIQDYFQDFSKELTNYNDMDLVDSDYTQTEIYKRKADKGIILTEEEVREYCERYGDSVAAVLISNISLGRITDDGSKTLTDYVNMNYQDGLYGYDINDNGEEEGKEKASYNQKTQEQETLEQMFWDYLTKTGRNDENKDHYDKMDKYIEDYGNEIGDTSKISTSNQYYRLCQTGFLNSAYTKDGARRYGREYLTEAEFNNDSEVKAKYDSYEKYYEENGGSHYEDPDTNKTVFVPYRNAEEQKNYDRYMNIVKSRGNSSNRFIYGSVFEEVCDAQDEYYEHSLPEYEEIASENLDLIVYDENNNPIGVKNNGDDSTIDDYYERANSAVEKYRESLDRIKLLETFVNQKQITESISSANSENREYSEEDFPPGVKEYLGFLDSKDKRKYMYQYVEKASLPYADTAKAYGNSIGSKVQTTLDMLKEMYGEEEGYIRAEGLKETIINNDNVYRSLIEQNNNVHDQNLGILFNIAQRIATEKREEYDRKNNDNSAVVSAGYWSQNEIDKENELKKEAESAEAEASRLANKMATSKILSNESKSIYEAGLYEIIKSKPVTERTTAENDFFLEYRAKNQVDIKEYKESIDNLYETLSKCNNFKEVCDIINNIGTINIEIENFIGNYKIRSQPDFEEKNKSKIFSLERIEEVDAGGGSTTIYINALDENGNKLDVSEEEIEIYLAGIAKENGGKLPLKYRMCYTKSSNQVDRINYLAKTDLEALTYKANTLDYNTFKFDYKSFVEFGALCKATEQYEKYVDILERGNDVEDWFVTVGYGAWAGGAQFVDGFKNLIDPDGLKNENDYRTMLISSYLLNEYGSDSLESNFMLGTYEVTTSIVNMLPTVILSCIPVVGQGLGLATMFLSTAGNATEQGLQSGMTPEQARLYGLINGALETGLQATVGGISKLTIGKLPVAKLITKNLGTILVEGAWYTAATNYLLNILSEGLEEGTQEILDPIIQRLFAASENNFIEMKESLSNLTLTEWQEEKFLEWKSNSLSGIANKEEYLNIYNTKFEDWLATSGIDEAMFDKIKSKEYTYEEWKEDNKLETSASALWGTIDWTAVKKSALYGAISGGIFEGSTQFVPEVISFVRTGTTLGIPAIMNSVRNQAEASGTPKNIFQILAETNQIIKEQSKTGKLGELVSEYMETESFQSDYENFMNEIEQSSKEQTETNATKSKLSNILKSIKETLGSENEMSEVNFATMQVAGSLVANAPLARISNILRDTNYKSYKEYLDRLSELNESETRLTEEIKQLEADNSDINSEINKDNLSKKHKELDEIQSEKNNITEAIEYYKKSTGTLRSDLASEALELLENIRNDEATLNELQQTLAEVESETDSTKVKELKNRIKGLKEKLENQRKSKKGITKTAERILLQNIEQYQNALKNLQRNELKGKENKSQQLKESIKELTENINSSKARTTEIDSILKILLNPESNISSLSSELFNSFVSELDLRSLQIYSKDIFARLSDMSNVSIENLLSRLDVITLGVFETEIVERIRQIKSNEILNRIKDKYGLRFTKDIYKIEADDTTTSDTTTSQTEAIAENTNSDSNTNSNTRNDVQTEVIEESTNSDNNTSQNTINNSQTETITRETTKARKDAPKTEVKKEIISQNGALGVVGIIQMTVIPGLTGNQTLNNVLETIQTDINSLKQRNDSTTINGEVNVETEVNVNEETNSNINVREELKAQIDQKTKLYNDLTQLMIKYGVDGSELLTTLKEKIVSGKYELEQQLLNTATNIEETITDSITESEAAIKEIMQQFDLTKADQTTLNEARTAAMYKILEIANKNNISVDSILSKINIDEMLAKNDVQSELEIAANRLNGIVEETDNLTEEDFKFLESEDAQGAEDYIVLMKAINNIRNLRFNTEDAQVIEEIYNRIKNQSPEFVRKDKMKCVTLYIAKLKMKMYKNNLLGTVNIKDGTKTIKVNMYGKDISSNLLINSLNEINKLLKETPSFMKETITEINLFDFDCDLDLFFALKYYNNIAKPYQASASSNGSEISFWKLGLSQLISEIPSEHAQGVRTLNHEIGHNIDKKLGECELSQDYWTFKNQLWNEAIERDGGRNYAPTEYAKTTLQEDFAESIAEYMSDPSYFTEKFPNRAKILQNIFKAYTKEIDCSYDKAAKRVNKHRLKEKLLYEKEIFECRKVLDKMVKKTDLNNTRPDVLKSIQELLYGQALDIAQKYNMSIEEVLERINYYKIFPKNNITVPEIITIAPLGRNALDFDNNINGNTNNNGETRNTTEGVKTIKSLDQIIDEDIRSKLVEAIEKNQESSKKFKEGKISGAIAALSWDEINEILKSSPNSKVVNELCKVWSTNAISPSMLMFNYEQTIEIVNELKKGISIETLMELDINGFLKGEKTIGKLYIDRAYAIIKEALIKEARKDKDFSDVKIGIEFARMIIKGNQQVIEYKEDSKYQNNFIKNLTKFSPKQLQEINNLFNVISGFEVCESEDDYKGKIAGKAGFGGKILDHIYKINEIYEEEVIKNGKEANKINLNIEIINGLLKLAPKLSSLSDCNSTISTLLSDYFYHDGDYIFINEKPHLNEKTGKEETKLRKYAEAILKSLGKTVDDVIRVDDNGNITIDETFATETVKNKLNNYETRILYNYLETNIKNRLVPKQKELDNSLYDLNKNIRKLNKEIEKLHEKIKNKANEIEELQQSLVTANNALAEAKDKKAQIIAEIRKNASNASSLRNELRVILQNAGFGINVLPKQGTNPLNTNYEGAVINKYISDNLTKNEIITLIKSLKRVTNEIESLEQKEAFRKKIEEVFNKVAKEGLEKNVESIKALVKKIVKYDSNLLPTMYQYLNEADFLISYEQMVFDGVFKSNDFVNIALGITSIEQSIFEEKIKSWEKKQDSFSSYTMLNRYNYYKFVKEVLDHGIVKTKIDWPKLGGYLGIPEQLMEFISKYFDVQEDIYISRHGDKKGTNVSLTLKSSVETVFGNLKDGSLARALPSRYGKDFMEGTINIKKYRTLCDCLYEYLSKENINDSTELTLINKLKENGIEVDTVNVKELIEAYQKAYNTSHTLQDFRIINKDFIKCFIKEGKTSEEFINLIKDASTEIQIEISDMISDYVTTKDERILDDVIETVKKDFIKRFIENDKTTIEDFNNLIKDASSEIKSEISDMINNYKATNDESILDNIVKKTGSFFEVRMNYDLKYGICGTIASFGDLPGGGSQATLMFSYDLLEKCGIIKDVRSGILTPKGSYLFPKELVENVSEENINSLKKAIYDLTEIGNNIIDISSKYEEIDGIIENIKNELKNSGKYTENIGKTIETFKEIMNFNKYIQTHKMTDIVKGIGKLSISEIDNLIENSSYIFELSESTKILNTIENLQEVIEEIPEARRTKVMDKILSKMTIENLQEVIDGIPEARRTQVMDAILVKMIKGEALSQETSDAIFKSKMFDGDSSFAKEYLHHIIEVGIPELKINGSKELANKISEVYEKARETTKEMSNLYSYCDHTEAHVLQVAFDTIEKAKQIAASKGQTLSETQIMNLFYAGLFHDLGMASGADSVLGIRLDTQKTNTKIKLIPKLIRKLIANEIRENHSLNSALQVLEMRTELANLGLNADLIAMMCFSHSKSNSGVGNLASEGDWSYSVSKIRSALKAINGISGKNIRFILENIGGIETLETIQTNSKQKINKDAKGKKIKSKLKVPGIQRIIFEEGVLNDLEIMSLAIRMGDAYVTKANVKLEEPIKWVGTDGKTYSTDLLVLTQAGVYMAYDATQTAISTKYKQTDDTETSVESAFIYLRKTKDGKFVPWKDGYGVDAEGKYTNVKDSLMYSEPVKTKDGKILTEEGYYYKEDKTAGTRTYYYKEGNAYTEVETILKERYNEAEEKYGKTLLTSTGKFLVGESNVTYSVEVRGDTLVSIYKIGDIEIFQNNTRSKGIYERLGEIATSRNIKHEVDIRFEGEQFESNFMKVGDRYVGITPIAQEYIAAIKDYQSDYEGIVLKINGVNINNFETNTFD